MIDGTVIIGTAPSLQNSGKGEYIDSFENIIRFPYKKDWQIPSDYGTRTTHFCSTDGRAMIQLNSFLPEKGYFIWSKYKKTIPLELQFLIKKFGGEDMTELIQGWQRRIPISKDRLMGHAFSTGTAGICIAAAKIKKPIIALGCDWIKNGGGKPEDYVGSWFWEGGKKPVTGGYRREHQFPAELKLIDDMSNEYGVSIAFE